MKKIWATLPADIKQTVLSIIISVCLICGSLFMLSIYANSMYSNSDSVDAMATPEESDAITYPESSLP